MQLDQAESLLHEAAAPTLAQIRRDREKAPAQLLPALRDLESQLFEPGFNVSQLMMGCGIRDNSFPLLFRQHLGVPPSVYIEDARMQTAVELLRRTELRVSRISDLLGYSTASSFSRAFARWSGLRPNAFRKADQAASTRAGEVRAELFSSGFWRRALVGELSAADAQQLRRRWRLLYPQPSAEQVPQMMVDGAHFESAVAAMVWETIRELPSAQQREFVRSRVSFRSPTLFELLLEESRQQGRRDRQRGIELAELALESLQGSAAELGLLLPDLSAKAWAWIGNARRLALDFAGAERAFGEAEICWTATEQRDPAAVAELYDLEAGLRVYQRRLVEAAELANKALSELDRAGKPPAQMCRVLLRRALIADLDGRSADAAADLQQARTYLPERDSHLELALIVNLATSLTLAEQYEEARQYLPRAEQLCAQHVLRLRTCGQLR